MVVVVNGLRPMFALREKYVSSTQTPYEIEKAILDYSQ